MSSQQPNIGLRQIFEYELRRKLSLKSKQTTSEMVMLNNNFKFYDINNIGKVDKSGFVKTFIKLGLSGFSQEDLEYLFTLYDIEQTGLLDYKHFTMSIYGLTQPIPITTAQTTTQPVAQQPLKSKPPSKPVTPLMKPISPLIPLDHSIKSNQELPIQQQQQQINMAMPPQTPIRNEVKNYFKFLLSVFRDKINIFNGLTYYTLLTKIREQENKYSHNISKSALTTILSQMKIDISLKEQNDFYSLLDLSDCGNISSIEFLRLIRNGPLNEERKMVLIEAFAQLDTERLGKCEVKLIKQKFNAHGHPDVRQRKISAEEIEEIFNYNIDVYCLYKNIYDTMNIENFLEFYEPLSACEPNERAFIDTIEQMWNLKPITTSQPSNNTAHTNITSNVNAHSNEEQTILILTKLKDTLSSRGTKGIFGFVRLFSIFDKDNSGMITQENFIHLCNMYKLDLTNNEVNYLFMNNNEIQYEHLIKAMYGTLSQFRKEYVFATFNKLSGGTGSEVINANTMKEMFNSLRHPDVAAGKKSPQEIYGEFLDMYESYSEYKHKNYMDMQISIDEFVEFYSMISLGISDDGYFEYMMVNCWGL